MYLSCIVEKCSGIFYFKSYVCMYMYDYKFDK